MSNESKPNKNKYILPQHREQDELYGIKPLPMETPKVPEGWIALPNYGLVYNRETPEASEGQYAPGDWRKFPENVGGVTSPGTQIGVKLDADKTRYDLLPPEALEGISQVLTKASSGKYKPRNWEKGISYGRVFSAMMRHLWAWWRGEKYDPEWGFSHLWHAGCCLMFLITYEARNMGGEWDDR